MNNIDSSFGSVFFGELALTKLDDFVASVAERKGTVFFLVDENTHSRCLDRLRFELPRLGNNETLEVPAGEESKSVGMAIQLWSAMLELGADRNAAIINVGGGMICDLGGFIAANFMRGIPFVNVPTSLLAMVDAAIGGKVAVNLDGVKNVVGLFASNKGTFIETDFLQTLPERELKAGWAEWIKHFILSDAGKFQYYKNVAPSEVIDKPELIRESAAVKIAVVDRDPHESGDRKILNFGHTLGHAFESYFLASDQHETLLHGEAIALGMWLETELSFAHLSLPRSQADAIQTILSLYFSFPKMNRNDWDAVLDLLKFDKKNAAGELRFVLLKMIGNPVRDVSISRKDIQNIIAKWPG